MTITRTTVITIFALTCFAQFSPASAAEEQKVICLYNRMLDNLAVATQVRMCSKSSYSCTDWTQASIPPQGNGYHGRTMFHWPTRGWTQTYMEIEAQSGTGLGLRDQKTGFAMALDPPIDNDRVCAGHSYYLCGTDAKTGNGRFYLQNGAQLSFDPGCRK